MPVVLAAAAVGGAREGGDEVRAAVAPPHALELAAARDRLGVGLVAGGDGLGVAVGDLEPLHPVGRSGPGGDRQVVDVRARPGRGAHRLQRAGVAGELAERALAQRQRVVGRGPAVQEAVRAAGVLRVVDAGALRLDDARLVRVAAEGLDRLRVAVGGPVVRVDLEDVAVALAGARLGLLAGQPGVPRRGPTGSCRRRRVRSRPTRRRSCTRSPPGARGSHAGRRRAGRSRRPASRPRRRWCRTGRRGCR